jgi:hypothetical protein
MKSTIALFILVCGVFGFDAEAQERITNLNFLTPHGRLLVQGMAGIFSGSGQISSGGNSAEIDLKASAIAASVSYGIVERGELVAFISYGQATQSISHISEVEFVSKGFEDPTFGYRHRLYDSAEFLFDGAIRVTPAMFTARDSVLFINTSGTSSTEDGTLADGSTETDLIFGLGRESTWGGFRIELGGTFHSRSNVDDGNGGDKTRSSFFSTESGIKGQFKATDYLAIGGGFEFSLVRDSTVTAENGTESMRESYTTQDYIGEAYFNPTENLFFKGEIRLSKTSDMESGGTLVSDQETFSFGIFSGYLF